MTPFQFIIAPLLIVLLIVLERRLRKQWLVRLLVVLLMLGGLGFVLVPQASTWLAHLLGIGRGVDLLLYLGLLGLSVTCLLLYLKLSDMQRQLTELARQQALLQARKPEKIKPPEQR